MPGVADLAGPAGSANQLAAVNVDPAESDPARLTVDQFQSAIDKTEGAATPVPQAAAREREDRQHLWQYALALMATVLAVESIVATRAA